MALRHKSAIRQHRRSLKRRTVNQRNKSLMKTRIKKFRQTLEAGNLEGARELLPQVFKAIDKTAAKGAIHKNTAARYKRRLSKQLKDISTQAA